MPHRRLVYVAALIALSASLAGCAATGQPSQDASGTVRVSADGAFVPSGPARAGEPIRLEFGPGAGCTAAVKFPEHGIFEDLTDGGGVVELPALAPGEYPLICQADMVMGVLTVD